MGNIVAIEANDDIIIYTYMAVSMVNSGDYGEQLVVNDHILIYR